MVFNLSKHCPLWHFLIHRFLSSQQPPNHLSYNKLLTVIEHSTSLPGAHDHHCDHVTPLGTLRGDLVTLVKNVVKDLELNDIDSECLPHPRAWPLVWGAWHGAQSSHSCWRTFTTWLFSSWWVAYPEGMGFDYFTSAPFLLCHGLFFVFGCRKSLVGSNLFLSMTVQQLVMILVFPHEELSSRSFYSTILFFPLGEESSQCSQDPRMIIGTPVVGIASSRCLHKAFFGNSCEDPWIFPLISNAYLNILLFPPFVGYRFATGDITDSSNYYLAQMYETGSLFALLSDVYKLDQGREANSLGFAFCSAVVLQVRSPELQLEMTNEVFATVITSKTWLLFLFSHSVMSDSWQPCGLQHVRLPCPLTSPGVCSNSCPLNRWCHLTISSSVAHFSSCPQSFPASGFFPMSQLFASGGQSIGASALASVLPMNIQGWFPLGLTGLIPLLSKGLSRVFFSTTIWKHQFFVFSFNSIFKVLL